MILKAEGISRQFIRESGDTNIFYAVRKTDFQLPQNALTVLEGRSGSGKTTFLNILSGLLSPSEGKVLLDDTDIYSMDDKALSLFRNRHFGIIPQGQTAVSTLTVLENVLLPATIYGAETRGVGRRGKNAGAGDPALAGGAASGAGGAVRTGAELTAKAEALLERMGIGHLKKVFPKELSGGELRRVSIARALIMEPEIIFADEPTSDLDDENTELVFGILREIARSGKAVLAVTHERNAEQFADRMFRMKSGLLEEVKLK